MKDFTLSQQYALIGLDGLDSMHPNFTKNAALRAIAAAKLLESLLDNFDQPDSTDFRQKLVDGLKPIKHFSRKNFRSLEDDTTATLLADGVLETIPDLLACDINYYTSGIDIKAYRSEPEYYTSITEGVRAEILENGPVTTECVFMLWLFRESGCIHDIFPKDEQTVMEQHILDLTTSNPLYRILWETEFHSSFELHILAFLKRKRDLFKTPFWQGVNMTYPFLDRRQSIFLDYVIFGTSVEDRLRQAMISFLTEKGHYVEEVKNGSETLLKINNAYYRIFPRMYTGGPVPVQGAHLLLGIPLILS